jgi:chromosomal replication initiation ATPase DnaA
LVEKFKGTQYEIIFAKIKSQLARASYNTFFKNAILDIEREEDTAIIKVKNRDFMKILKNKYMKLIEDHFFSIGVEKIIIDVGN